MSTPTAIEITRATVKETAAALRKALREAFPGVKFSVRMATGTAYGWLSLSWTDGPTSAQVRKIAANFESERFSGMDDSYHSTAVTQWSCCGITEQRSISPDRIAEAVAMIERDTDGEAFIRRPDGSVAFPTYPHSTDEQLALIYWQKVAA